MDDDEQPPPKKYPVSISKLSKTPSWIMLGFVLGALFVIALPPIGDNKPAPAPLPPMESPTPKPAPEPPQLTTIEAVFESWKDYARWADDTTEVALWNSEQKDFSDFYEVRRFEGVYYFRTIPRLTRRILTHGKPLPSECPLRFTETVEQYREWLEQGGRALPSNSRDLRPLLQTAPSNPATTTPLPSVQPPPVVAPPSGVEPSREK